MKSQDKYKEVKTFQFTNAVVRVHIPDITKAERERRMKTIHKATVSMFEKGVAV